MKSLRQKLFPQPLSLTKKENAQTGFEPALIGMPIFPVQHLTTRTFSDLLKRGVFHLLNLKLGFEESSFNIQRDEVSEMLRGFLIEICILEAVTFLDLCRI